MIKSKYVIVILLALAELTTGSLHHLVLDHTFIGDLVAALGGSNSGDRNGLNPH